MLGAGGGAQAGTAAPSEHLALQPRTLGGRGNCGCNEKHYTENWAALKARGQDRAVGCIKAADALQATV